MSEDAGPFYDGSPMNPVVRAASRSLVVLVGLALVASVAFTSPGEDDAAEAIVRPAIDPTSISELPVRGGWGVTTFDTGASHNFENLVWDFAQIGDTMYVAGSFLHVTDGRNGTLYNQPYLAAFDIYTGDWVQSFAPTLDGAVYALEVSPDGFLIAGGEFTALGGEANTAGLVGINPATGARDSRFLVSLERPWSSEPAIARALEIVGDDLYVGGNFSHVRGKDDNQTRRAYKVARVNARWGTPDGLWTPQITGGAVWGLAVDTARNRIHLSGISLSGVNGATADRLATVDLATGATVPGQAAVSWNNASAKDIWDVEVAGGNVYTAGTEHVLQVLDGASRSMVGWHTTGHQSDGYSWVNYFTGGDFQVAERIGNYVVGGCHCTYEYRSNRGYTGNTWYDNQANARLPIRLAGIVNTATNQVVEWSPDLAGSEEGVWAVGSDTLGCLWLGGQFDVAGAETNSAFWVGNFARFCPPDAPVGTDNESPTAPANLAATAALDEVTLTWDAATDNILVAGYIVERDGLEIATVDALTYVDASVSDGWHDYRVRAIDPTGNRSTISNTVSIQIDSVDNAPSTPTNLVANVTGSDVALSWEAAIDDVAVSGYAVYRDGAYLGWATSTTFADNGLPDGEYSYEVRAYDTASNRSAKSDAALATVGVVAGPDTEAPSIPANVVAVANGADVSLSWDPSTDNVGVTGYAVYRNGSYAGWASGTSFVDADLADGDYSYRLRAYDAAGNRTTKSPAVTVSVGVVAPADTEDPTVPVNVAAAVAGSDVTVTWDPATDNVGIDGYAVYRSGAYAGWATGTSFTETGVADGDYTYTVRAYDTAGNRSDRSAGAEATVGAPVVDVLAPTVPENLAGVLDAADVLLTWDPSVDETSLDGYAVYRDGAYIGWAATETYTDTGVGAGTYAYTLRAYDDAGNRSDRSVAAVVTVP